LSVRERTLEHKKKQKSKQASTEKGLALSRPPSLDRYRQLQPFFGNPQPRLFVERVDRLGGLLTGLVRLPAEFCCFVIIHGPLG
jgi:hypothetical protein